MPKNLIHVDKIVADFRLLVEPACNKALYESVSGGQDIASEVPGLAITPGYRLLRVDNRLDIAIEHFELALVSSLTGEVVYYNRVIIQRDQELNSKPASQVLVWRDGNAYHRPALRGLAEKIFFGYLIERYNVIISDVNQTTDGMAFWQYRMSDALILKMHVYAYDVMTGELCELLTQHDIKNKQAWLWGDADHYQHRLAIISKVELPAQ